MTVFKNISKANIGSDEVIKAYHGSDLVFEKPTGGGGGPYAVSLAGVNSASNACFYYGFGAVSTYYLDAPTLADATMIWQNEAMTNKAFSNYYSDGSIARQWNSVTETLGTATSC
ncbi:hypothetical protein MG296_10550 [Flavobacteriaceae bacterium TK19130]|nr:hypothetical protein [Thermobacterium salinum]